MPYATSADIETIYSANVLDRIAYNPDLPTPGRDPAMISRAVDEASAEIDTHLSVAFSVPIEPTPPILRQLCVDIAIYRMALTFDKLTLEITERYKSATKMLERIADGKAGLGIPRTAETENTPVISGDFTSIDAERS